LSEAAILSAVGALGGLALAYLGAWVTVRMYPEFPVSVPYWAVTAASGMALATGLIFGMLPARRAAALDPVEALSRR
jgi:putative ABC transport system permease protein